MKNIDPAIVQERQNYWLLQILNKILECNDRPAIESYYDFKLIPRYEIVIEPVYQFIKDNEHRIYLYFDKTTCGYYRTQKELYNYNMSVIRGICRQMGLKWKIKWISTGKYNSYTVLDQNSEKT